MKKNLILFIALCFFINYQSFSQKTFSLKAKITNRYAFRGTIIQTKNYDLISPLNTDSGLYIVRAEKTGKLKWQKKFGITGDQVFRISATPDNGFACFGNFYNTTASNRQLNLFKCDSIGTIQWSKSLGLNYTNYFIYADQLILDAKNNYVITYHLQPKFSYQTAQMRIIKFNESGDIVFQTGFKNLYNSSYQSLQVTSLTESFDGGFLIGLNYVYSLFGIEYSFLLLTNSSGNVVSYKPFSVYPFNAEDYQAPISVYKNNGKYYVIGYYNHYEKGKVNEYYYFTTFNKKQQATTATLVPYNRFALEQFITKNKIPIKIIDGYVINAHNLTAVDYTTNEAFIDRYDSFGRICPDYSLPVFDSVVQENNIFIGDEISGVEKSVDSIIITSNEISVQDIYLFKDICSGETPSFTKTNISQNATSSNLAVTIFPNPAHNKITISIPSLKNQQLQLYNTESKLLQSIQANNNHITLDISGYKNGFYIIKIVDNNQTQILKFIKQ